MRSLRTLFLSDGGGPRVALPIGALGGRSIGHAFPPDAAFGSECHVGEDGIAGERSHRIGIRFHGRAGGDAKEASLRVNGTKLTSRIGLDPRDVIADGPDLPAIEAVGGDEHGEVGLAAGAGEGGGHVGLLAFRVFHAQNEHVFGEPAFVPRDIRGNAQGEALLTQQRVSTITGTIRPDFPGFREVDNVLLLITRPRNISLPGSKRRANRVHAGHNTLHVLVDFGVDRHPDAGHDAHVDHCVR